MKHFTLPEALTDLQWEKVKKCALKKMATQFQSWKKTLWTNYFEGEKKTPKFKGEYVKLADDWDEFVKFKESEEAKKRSRINKINANKKTWHHRLGPGGYKSGLPKWDESERNMKAAGVTPVTETWPERCRTWFYAHGGKLDPKTGEIIEQASLKEASDALLEAIKEARMGAFQPQRENDELTRALKNPEHPGRTRGKGMVPWFLGFADWNDSYRSRDRKKKHEVDQIQDLERKYNMQQEQINKLSQQGAS